MPKRNRWRSAFLDQDYKQKLRREMDTVTREFASEPKCRWCRDTGRVQDRRTRVERPCPRCGPPSETDQKEAKSAR